MIKDEKIAKKPPVKVGQVIDAVPTGFAEKDPFLSFNEFIIFIKKMPAPMIEKRVRIKVSAVKERFAFAEYQGESDETESKIRHEE